MEWIGVQEGGRRGTYRVTFTQWLDIQKGKHLFGFEEFEGGDVACD